MARTQVATTVARDIQRFTEAVKKPLTALIADSIDQSLRVFETVVDRTGALVDSALDQARRVLEREPARD